MRQIGKIRFAQDQADVRIRDQKTVAIDHVCFALLADFDARHHVPDELEIDLRDRHGPGIAALADRDRHVRLGFLAEVHGSEPGLPALSTAECRFLRPILARSENVHAESRHRDLLAARTIELRNVGNLGRLAQQFQELDAAQLDITGIELR